MAKRSIHGWVNLNKPLHMSSAQAVGAIKRITQAKKVGHAGTLDPLADGVLPIALGEATKTSNYMMGAVKGYEFTLCFGEARSTDDAEGEVVDRSAIRPSEVDIQAVLSEFIGEISQIPPAYSAIKVDGRRAYALARAGEIPELIPRNIMIHDLRLLSMMNEKQACFSVSCGKGTYIRSLARDIAHRLGSVGYVARLRRTRVGKFTLEGAISLDFLEKLLHNPDSADAEASAEWLMPISTALDDIPAISVDDAEAAKLRHGQFIELTSDVSGEAIAAMKQEELVAIGIRQGNHFKPSRVFNY